MRISLSLVVLAALAIPAVARAERVIHLPPADAPAGAPLEIAVTAPAATPMLLVHFRAAGRRHFTAQKLLRQGDTRWVAVLSGRAVEGPWLDYYITAGVPAGGATEATPVFASNELPHRTRIVIAKSAARRTRDEARSGGRRSRVRTAFEWVDYGGYEREGRALTDRYYRIDADFAYRLWAYPLDELRVGYTRLIGDKEAMGLDCRNAPVCNNDAGFKVAGWFELGLAPIEGVGVDARMMVLATQTGFSVGGRGELRVGVRDATHVATGVEYMADVGMAGFFRFGWGTVPRLPMAATVEITKLPASSADAGVRLYYDVGFQVRDALRLGVRAGYAARMQERGGFTGGASAIVDF